MRISRGGASRKRRLSEVNASAALVVLATSLGARGVRFEKEAFEKGLIWAEERKKLYNIYGASLQERDEGFFTEGWRLKNRSSKGRDDSLSRYRIFEVTEKERQVANNELCQIVFSKMLGREKAPASFRSDDSLKMTHFLFMLKHWNDFRLDPWLIWRPEGYKQAATAFYQNLKPYLYDRDHLPSTLKRQLRLCAKSDHPLSSTTPGKECRAALAWLGHNGGESARYVECPRFFYEKVAKHLSQSSLRAKTEFSFTRLEKIRLKAWLRGEPMGTEDGANPYCRLLRPRCLESTLVKDVNPWEAEGMDEKVLSRDWNLERQSVSPPRAQSQSPRPIQDFWEVALPVEAEQDRYEYLENWHAGLAEARGIAFEDELLWRRRRKRKGPDAIVSRASPLLFDIDELDEPKTSKSFHANSVCNDPLAAPSHCGTSTPGQLQGGAPRLGKPTIQTRNAAPSPHKAKQRTKAARLVPKSIEASRVVKPEETSKAVNRVGRPLFSAATPTSKARAARMEGSDTKRTASSRIRNALQQPYFRSKTEVEHESQPPARVEKQAVTETQISKSANVKGHRFASQIAHIPKLQIDTNSRGVSLVKQTLPVKNLAALEDERSSPSKARLESTSKPLLAQGNKSQGEGRVQHAASSHSAPSRFVKLSELFDIGMMAAEVRKTSAATTMLDHLAKTDQQSMPNIFNETSPTAVRRTWLDNTKLVKLSDLSHNHLMQHSPLQAAC